MTRHRIALIGHLAHGVTADDILASALQAMHPRALVKSARIDRGGAWPRPDRTDL